MKKSLVLIFGFVIALTAAPFVQKGVAADKVTLGIAISQTGRYAEPAGRMVNSYNLYVDQMNAKGGWNGQKIDMVMMDDKSDK
jgi:branched-chain amino acid transport system substrate-binding protein